MFNKDNFINTLKDAFNNGDSEKFFEARIFISPVC